MEQFRGKAHIPGCNKEWNIQLEIDWAKKEVDVTIEEVPGGVKEWPGLAVQTFGPLDEIVFRTKGIPSVFTRWWHFVRGASCDLRGIVLGIPDMQGIWRTCMITMNRANKTDIGSSMTAKGSNV